MGRINAQCVITGNSYPKILNLGKATYDLLIKSSFTMHTTLLPRT